MEKERRRSGTSLKSSKIETGCVKHVRPLIDEEAARRREEVERKLRKKLEVERRALKIVERLLDDSVTEDFLTDCAQFITPDYYRDAVEERSITKLCGYPLCPNKLGKIPSQKYTICTKTNKVYDITERKCFCSNFCYKASKEFELQISKTPLWLRQHESPPKIKLMMKGAGGSAGEEVILSERRLREEDIENPLTPEPKDPHSSQQCHAAGSLRHSDSSDSEQEQDFVSSIVSQRQGPRVHWGNLPKRTEEGRIGKQEKEERRQKHSGEEDMEKMEHQHQKAEKEEKTQEDRTHAEQMHTINTAPALSEENTDVEEATAKMKMCSVSETVTNTASVPVNVTSVQEEHTTQIISPPLTDSKPPAETKPFSSSALSTTHQHSVNTTTPTQTALSITRVGMSKKGAAGLRGLLKNHAAAPETNSIRVNLLEHLRRTLKEWGTDETVMFLYGANSSPGTLITDVKEKDGDGEEELDEDDLEDEVTEEDGARFNDVLKRPPAAGPDYETLRKETQQLELRVREFYRGTWILPEEVEVPDEKKLTVQEQGTKDAVLPLVDSHAQHLIQKRIAVEKLTNSIRNIVGPLHLTMSDVTVHLNNLVRTFRFTNTNIIHKAPEWTLVAVVLLHFLSEVSPVVQKALEATASVEYLNTLMEELGLQEQDLLNLVQVFKSQ